MSFIKTYHSKILLYTVNEYLSNITMSHVLAGIPLAHPVSTMKHVSNNPIHNGTRVVYSRIRYCRPYPSTKYPVSQKKKQ